MKWFFSAVLATMCVLNLSGRIEAADDKDATVILDKAIKASAAKKI